MHVSSTSCCGVYDDNIRPPSRPSRFWLRTLLHTQYFIADLYSYLVAEISGNHLLYDMAEEESDISQLSAEQQLALQQYVAVTDQDLTQALPLLKRCEWNIQVRENSEYVQEHADCKS
jgi:hypothetical protein